MPDKATIERIRDAVDIAALIGQYVKLQKQGSEHVGLCPFHTEKTPSFKVNPHKQLYKCFGCGESGDCFTFIKKKLGVEFQEAVAICGAYVGIDAGALPKTFAKPKKLPPPPPSISDQENLLITGFDDKPPNALKPLGKATAIYDYKTAAGITYLRVCRWDLPNGKKDIRQLCRLLDGSLVWNKKQERIVKVAKTAYFWHSIPADRRGMYNADKMAAATDIIICEGEKAAEAIGVMYAKSKSRVVGTTWIGGTGNVEHFDVAAAIPKDKRVVLWADWDAKGIAAMETIAAKLLARGQAVKWVQIPPGKPSGWDAADAVAEGMSPKQFATGKTPPILPAAPPPPPAKPQKAAAPTTPPPPPKKAAKTPPAPSPSPAPPQASRHLPMTCVPLGYDGGFYYFWDAKTASVVKCRRTTGGVQGVLITLASHAHWERHFGQNKTGKVNWLEAISYAIRQCEAQGSFNSERIKGRGVYVDENRAVLNTGRLLIVEDGSVVPITEQGLKFDNFFSVRPTGDAIPLPMRKGKVGANGEATYQPPSAADAGQVNTLASMIFEMGWRTKEQAIYLFGWLAISVISGALPWRPHLWISGASGSGKSWIMRNIVRKCLGRYAISVDANTSEASIRWGADDEARPIIFDEAESKRRGEKENMESVLALARATSSEDGARVMKAGGGGEVKIYKISSCFAFSSITMPLNEAADISRFVHLSLRRQALKGLDWDKVRDGINSIGGNDFWATWCIRAFHKTRQILAAAETWRATVREWAADQRIGDTRGILLAGAWAMLQADNATMPTREKITDFVSAWHINTEKDSMAGYDLDDSQAIDIIASRLLRFGENNRFEMSVAEMVGDVANGEYEKKEFVQVLARYGIRVLDGNIYFAKSPNLKKFFRDTPWESSWYEILKQQPSSETGAKGMRFGAMTYTAHIFMPVEKFLKEDNNGN